MSTTESIALLWVFAAEVGLGTLAFRLSLTKRMTVKRCKYLMTMAFLVMLPTACVLASWQLTVVILVLAAMAFTVLGTFEKEAAKQILRKLEEATPDEH